MSLQVCLAVRGRAISALIAISHPTYDSIHKPVMGLQAGHAGPVVVICILYLLLEMTLHRRYLPKAIGFPEVQYMYNNPEVDGLWGL